MTDLEINRALARAIGWKNIRIIHDLCIVDTGHALDRVKVGKNWVAGRVLDYRDPAVIWPIAERYGAFPSDMVSGDFKKHQQQGYPDIEGWEVFMTDYKRSTLTKAKWLYYRADTAAKAVALAVIGSTK